METVDVCIVGAGPAGVSAALELERLNVRHILIDKAVFPRGKPCAGILPPKITELVGPLPDGVFERRIRGYFLHTVSGAVFRSAFPTPGYSVDRSTFDAWLVSRLRTPPRLQTFLDAGQDPGLVHVHAADSDLLCRVLIGADGANSRVRATAGIPAGRMAVACQASVAMSPLKIMKTTGGWFHIFYVVAGGYGWVAPHSGKLMVGIGSILPKCADRKALDAFLSNPQVTALTGGSEIGEIQTHRIPIFGPLKVVGHGRILLAGDAGGFVFPGTGEGVRFAWESGRCAARAVAETLLKGVSGAVLQRQYRQRLREEGLLSLREVDFQKVLSTPWSAENYVKKLTSLSRTASSS